MTEHFNEHKCLECGKSFSKYRKFYDHKKSHRGIIYRCIQCPSTYKSTKGLKDHSRTVHELRKFECHHCQTTFKAKRTLKRHMSLHFNSIVYQCAARFFKHAALQHNSLICSNSNVNNLNCIDVPAPQKQAQVKTNVQRKKVEKEFKCLDCGKIFSKYRNLYNHKKRHEGIIYQCAQCPSAYQTRYGLTYHSRTMHELRKFECHHCQSSFKAKITLKRHMTVHFNIIEKEYECLECRKIFSNYQTFYNHKKMH
jgi:DNA-directed RNA polymerase subunit RPC12/RpoP